MKRYCYRGVLYYSLVAASIMLATASNSLAQSVDGYVFWGSHTQHMLKRSDLDGGNVSSIYQPAYTPTDIDVDPIHEKVYWVDGISPAIYASDYDGNNVATALSLSLPPSSVSVDPATGKLFWVDHPRQCLGSTAGDNLPGKPLPFAESDCETRIWGYDPAKLAPERMLGSLVTPELPDSIYVDERGFARQENILAIDTVALRIYWGEGSRIRRSDMDGSNSEIVYSAPARLTSIAVDPTLDKLCWTVSHFEVGCSKRDGTSVSILDTTSTTAHSLRIKPDSQEIFWVADGPGVAKKVSLSGGVPSVVVSFSAAGIADSVKDLLVDAAGGHLFLAVQRSVNAGVDYNTRREIWRGGLDGSGLARIDVADPDGISEYPGSMWAFGSNLYWREKNMGLYLAEQDRIMVMDKSGGAPALVTEIPSSDIQSSHLVYTSGSNYMIWIENHAIKRSQLDGTGVEILFSEPTAMRVLDNRVCFLYPDGVRCMNRDGTGSHQVISSDTTPEELVIDSTAGFIFWIDRYTRDVMRANLDGSNKSVFLRFQSNQICNEIAGDTTGHYLLCLADRALYRAPMSDPSLFAKLPSRPEDSFAWKLYSLVVDSSADRLYYLVGAYGPYGSTDLIVSSRLNGTGLTSDTNQKDLEFLALASGGNLYYPDFDVLGALVSKSISGAVATSYVATQHSLDGGAGWVRELLLDRDPLNGRLFWHDSKNGAYYAQAEEDMFKLLGFGGNDVEWDTSNSLAYIADSDGVHAVSANGSPGLTLTNAFVSGGVYRLIANLTGTKLYALSWDIASVSTVDGSGAIIETNAGIASISNLTYLAHSNSIIWTDGNNDPSMSGDLFPTALEPLTGTASEHPPYSPSPDPSPYIPGAIYKTTITPGTQGGSDQIVTSLLVNTTGADVPFGIGVVSWDIPAVTYSVSGTVTVNTQPFSGQVVSGGANLGLATTLANGSYAFTGIAGGTAAAMSVTAPGYTFVEATGQPLSFTVSSNTIRNYLGTPNKITGYAHYAASPNPVAPGVTVSNGISFATTDQSGYYELVAVPNGTYTMTGLLSNTRVEVASGSSTVVINDNSQTVDFLVYTEAPPPETEVYSIAGYVHISGSPAAQQSVVGGTILGNVVTDGVGNYRFENLEAGTPAELSVTKEGYHFAEATNQPLQFAITGNAVRNFEGEPNRIYGFVRYANFEEEPVSGAEVSAGAFHATSSSSGAYEISGIPNGTYNVAGVYGKYLVEVERGVNPVTVENNSQEVNLWVYPEKALSVYAPWNGFLSVTPIVETINNGLEPLVVDITLYGMGGARESQLAQPIRAVVSPGQERDFIINDMAGFEQDRYGIVKVTFSNPHYSGRVTYYKPVHDQAISWSSSEGEQFDYVFVNPFVNPVKGRSYVSYNTFQPSQDPAEAKHLVPNWLTIINAHSTEEKYFKVRKYDERGNWLGVTETVGTVRQNCQVVESDLRCKVQPMGRIDVDGGHVAPGPDHVGLVEIIPEDSDSAYTANLIRYGMKATPDVWTSNYAFGMYFQTRGGSTRSQVMPLSHPLGGDNWVEVANIEDFKIEVALQLLTYSGEVLKSWNQTLKPRQTQHLHLSEDLVDGQSATVRLRGLNGRLIAQSVLYYRNNDRAIASALSLQSREQYSKLIYGTYNSFLSVYQWLKVANLDSVERQLSLRLDNGQSFLLTLSPYGGLDIALHDEMFGIVRETIGSFEIEDTQPGRIFAELIRVKPGEGGQPDFVLGTDVE